MTLTQARVQEIGWKGVEQSQCSIAELRELCRLALANLETQEWLERPINRTPTVPVEPLLAKLRGGR
jgi:hypothetical protein